MRIHIFQHVAFEGPGHILEWAKLKGFQITYTEFFKSEFSFPEISSVDALIILGGPMSVHDRENYPWLEEEKSFISSFIESRKKILGICLGAQLCALCLGAEVKPAKHKEIGWFQVFPKEMTEIGWIQSAFKDIPVVFHWHGDEFQIPLGAGHLLSSDANPNQAFLYREQILGLQFHAEATRDTVRALIAHSAKNIYDGKYVQSMNGMETGFEHINNQNQIMEKILNRFLM